MVYTEARFLKDIQVERYVLEKIRMGISRVVPGGISLSSSLEAHPDYLAKQIVYEFRTYLAGKKHERATVTETVKFPWTWWEHTKERFAPKWFLKRWPVSYKVIDIKAVTSITNICPHIDIPVDDKRHIEYVYYENTGTTF